MAEMTDRRRVVRITVPWHLTGPGFELRMGRLLDLSLNGARIEHPEPVRQGVVCYVDLPPALGQIRLTGRVVWTKLYESEQTFEGERRLHYQSGLAFIGVTPEQQTSLAGVLERLKAMNEETEREVPR